MKKNTTPMFKTPEGYFDGFYKRLTNRIKHEPTSMKTSIIPKSEGFVVPKGYFEGFPKKGYLQYPQSGKRISLKAYKKCYYYAAALAALFLFIFGLTWKTQPVPTFEMLADTEIEAYFENYALEMNTYGIAEVLPVNTIAWNNALETDITAETLWSYLSETIEDVETLNIEYNAYP